MTLDDIRKLNGLLDHAEDMLAGEREGLNAIYDKGKADGIHPGAMKSARRLAKAKPGDRRLWFATFDAAREALGLDAQLDLEDAVAQAARH